MKRFVDFSRWTVSLLLRDTLPVAKSPGTGGRSWMKGTFVQLQTRCGKSASQVCSVRPGLGELLSWQASGFSASGFRPALSRSVSRTSGESWSSQNEKSLTSWSPLKTSQNSKEKCLRNVLELFLKVLNGSCGLLKSSSEWCVEQFLELCSCWWDSWLLKRCWFSSKCSLVSEKPFLSSETRRCSGTFLEIHELFSRRGTRNIFGNSRFILRTQEHLQQTRNSFRKVLKKLNVIECLF